MTYHNLQLLAIRVETSMLRFITTSFNAFCFFLKNSDIFAPVDNSSCHFQILVKVVPTKGGHSVKIQWPLMRENLDEISASRYVTHTLGYKGEGSIFSILEKLGKFYGFPDLDICSIPLVSSETYLLAHACVT